MELIPGSVDWQASWLSFEDDVPSPVLRIQPALSFDQATLVDNTKAIGHQIKFGQDVTGDEDGHAEFTVEVLIIWTEFLIPTGSRPLDGSTKNEEVGFLVMSAIAIPKSSCFIRVKNRNFFLPVLFRPT